MEEPQRREGRKKHEEVWNHKDAKAGRNTKKFGTTKTRRQKETRRSLEPQRLKGRKKHEEGNHKDSKTERNAKKFGPQSREGRKKPEEEKQECSPAQSHKEHKIHQERTQPLVALRVLRDFV